jgi:hypothetical protein
MHPGTQEGGTMSQMKNLMADIIRLAGQTSVYSECGSDYDPQDCCPQNCKYAVDCHAQYNRVQATERLLKQLEALA